MPHRDNAPDETSPTCIACGKPVTTAFTEVAEPHGKLVPKDYCDACVNELRLTGASQSGSKGMSQVPWSSLALFLGVALGVFGLAADHLRLEGHSGFGWHQQLGVLAGLLFVLIGAAFRVDLLVLAGSFLFLLALFVDFLGIGHSAGVGPRQQMTIGLAAALLLGSLVLGRRHRRHGS